MFPYSHAGQAMALFVVSANVGPSIGSPIGEAVAENLSFNWWYYINIIIGVGFAIILALLPETQPSVVIAKAAEGDPLADKIRQRKSSLDAAKEMYFIASEALKILFTEPIVAFLGVFNGFAYGLLFLYLDVALLYFDVYMLMKGCLRCLCFQQRLKFHGGRLHLSQLRSRSLNHVRLPTSPRLALPS
jgi:MFS family permease